LLVAKSIMCNVRDIIGYENLEIKSGMNVFLGAFAGTRIARNFQNSLIAGVGPFTKRIFGQAVSWEFCVKSIFYYEKVEL